MAITAFKDEYRFLSNFWECPVRICFPEIGECVVFASSEHAFQAAKCPSRAKEFLGLTPGQAKRLGRSVELRDDWEDVKDDVMYEVVLSKFAQNAVLRDKLLSTGDEELIEGNNWGDRYWGQVNGVGKNMLGKTLMRVREELRGGSASRVGKDGQPASSSVPQQKEERDCSIEPIPSVDVPMVKVVDEHGNEVRRGYYFRWETRQLCPAGDKLVPEEVKECVVYSGFADWNMPREIQIMVVEEPNHIELFDDGQPTA